MTTCKHCGTEYKVKARWNHEGDQYSEGYCRNCQFWLPKVDMKTANDTRQVVVDGVHYLVTDNDSPGMGHGGREFVIKFHDGRTVVARNLWRQGPIDPPFDKVLVDNAVFVDDLEDECEGEDMPF